MICGRRKRKMNEGEELICEVRMSYHKQGSEERERDVDETFPSHSSHPLANFLAPNNEEGCHWHISGMG